MIIVEEARRALASQKCLFCLLIETGLIYDLYTMISMNLMYTAESMERISGVVKDSRTQIESYVRSC